MTSPISAPVYQKLSYQEQKEPETTTGATAQFNNLSAEVVPQASTKIPPPDNSQSSLKLESDCFAKRKGLHSVILSSARPPLEFNNMKEIECRDNTLIYRDLLKYHRNADGLLQEEEYSGCGNTVKEFTGVYVFNDIDDCQFRPHKNFGPSDPHSIHAGQFDDGTFFLLALNPALCKMHFEYDSHNNVGYFGSPYLTCSSGSNTHSLYCGKTYQEAVESFELACKGSIVATNIRESLGFRSDSIGTTLEAQKPEKPEAMDIDAQRKANLLWAAAKHIQYGLDMEMTPELKEALAEVKLAKPMLDFETFLSENKDMFPPTLQTFFDELKRTGSL
ncbi:hypothetical protein [Endozoicomonas sp. YOMI1]|uniref:hypothetical protein n=1 Tax=Endozoicomonas sp. YOMI1 TaxID=2828739 RepID=UPI002148C62F|nr:hypothetical protein [Endozoicomonas sp. YOMI1]